MWKLTKDKKILIVGLGLLGGSYAEALTDLGYHVGALTRSESSIQYALEKETVSTTSHPKERYKDGATTPPVPFALSTTIFTPSPILPKFNFITLI